MRTVWSTSTERKVPVPTVPKFICEYKWHNWPVSKDVWQAEVLVVLFAVQVEEVGDIDVGDTEGVRLVPGPAWPHTFIIIINCVAFTHIIPRFPNIMSTDSSMIFSNWKLTDNMSTDILSTDSLVILFQQFNSLLIWSCVICQLTAYTYYVHWQLSHMVLCNCKMTAFSNYVHWQLYHTVFVPIM